MTKEKLYKFTYMLNRLGLGECCKLVWDYWSIVKAKTSADPDTFITKEEERRRNR